MTTIEIQSDLPADAKYFLVAPEDDETDWIEMYSVERYGVVSGPVVVRWGSFYCMLATNAWHKAGKPGLAKIANSVLPGYPLDKKVGLMLLTWIDKEDLRCKARVVAGQAP